MVPVHSSAAAAAATPSTSTASRANIRGSVLVIALSSCLALGQRAIRPLCSVPAWYNTAEKRSSGKLNAPAFWGTFGDMAQLRITPLHPSLGAEVAGVDLGAPIDEPTRQELNRALADHLALVFRDQSLTPAQYLAAASAFGPPMQQHYSQHNMPDFPLIGLIWHRNGQQPAERWHTAHTNRERPPAATILYGVEIPSAGGGTSVASMRAAYLALPEDERRRLESLTTFNGLDGHDDTRPEDREKYGRPVEHPMVRTHPVHGSRAVYFH